MSSSEADRAVAAILYNIALAHSFLDGLTLEQFSTDQRTLYAVTRCLEIISEATRRLPGEAKAKHPDVPWARIAGAGNVYRHDYEDVLASILWNTVHFQLSDLESAVEAIRGGP
jgi:uncharacterized protein with HEPN domain